MKQNLARCRVMEEEGCGLGRTLGRAPLMPLTSLKCTCTKNDERVTVPVRRFDVCVAVCEGGEG